ncbi:MAG: hypothetical protein HY744_09820 [Deltaproteobacteria bacterium]|nr:hypothetical protein [Deltaproteobacteria bacterium]
MRPLAVLGTAAVALVVGALDACKYCSCYKIGYSCPAIFAVTLRVAQAPLPDDLAIALAAHLPDGAQYSETFGIADMTAERWLDCHIVEGDGGVAYAGQVDCFWPAQGPEGVFSGTLDAAAAGFKDVHLELRAEAWSTTKNDDCCPGPWDCVEDRRDVTIDPL